MSSVAPRQAIAMDYHAHEPQETTTRGSQTWISRGANFVVAYSEGKAGDVFARSNTDEYMIAVLDAPARITIGDQTLDLEAQSLAIVPPGESQLELLGEGRVVRVFSHLASDLLAAAMNALAYSDPTPEVAPLEPWPTPIDGWKLRYYRMADYQQLQKIFISTNLMINWVQYPGPRSTAMLSPHSHDDFEQGSLLLRGDWVHDLRYPWTRDMAEWREDEHIAIGSPSLTIIPPSVIHTSRAVTKGLVAIIDIFAPPRHDFADNGMVCNAADYPAPAKAATA